MRVRLKTVLTCLQLLPHFNIHSSALLYVALHCIAGSCFGPYGCWNSIECLRDSPDFDASASDTCESVLVD